MTVGALRGVGQDHGTCTAAARSISTARALREMAASLHAVKRNPATLLWIAIAKALGTRELGLSLLSAAGR